jgi:hypothetical protein
MAIQLSDCVRLITLNSKGTSEKESLVSDRYEFVIHQTYIYLSIVLIFLILLCIIKGVLI